MGNYFNVLSLSRYFPFSFCLLGKRYGGGRVEEVAPVSHMTRGRAFTLSLVLSRQRKKGFRMHNSTLIMRYHG